MATGVGVVLLAGLVVAIADVVHTGGAALQVLGLWSLLTLPVAIGAGLVLAAGNATWGNGWVRGLFSKLRDDSDLDRTVSAVLIAAVFLAAVLIVAVGKLSVGLVGDVQRKSVGGLLLGVIVVALVPMLALAAIPLYRITRRATVAIPTIGPLSRVVILLVAGVVAVAGAGLFVIFKKLDYQALNLGSLFAPALMPVVAIVLSIVLFGPASGLRERIPMRGAVVAVGVAIALVLPFISLRGPQTPAHQVAITDHSYVGPRLIPALRKLVDHDHDGFSAFFGGPDCNDSNKDIHPGVVDTPDNGVDENCDGFDNTSAPTLPELPKTAAPVATTLKGGDNVVVIFVDTLRYDRLGFTGYQRDGKSLTPRIDAFAKQSVVFSHAYSQASNTPRSVPSFLASRYPTQLHVDAMIKNYPTVLDDNDLLFEVLKGAGFTTVGESSHFYFCDHEKYPDTCDDVKNTNGDPMRTNAIQGADLWDNTGALPIAGSNHDIAGPRIVEKAKKKLAELADKKQKFAMVVHMFEPHSTYMEHDGFPITEHGTAALAQKYDYEIAFEDKLIGELLDQLDASKLADTTTVILMSDHGESFGVHTFGGERQFFHGMTLYNEVLHVPLMFRVPGNKPRMADDVVELVDLSPTIAALFGVKAPASWMGRSLVPALEGTALPPKPAFSEMPPSKSWNHDARSMISADGKRHVFHRISDSRWEVYDLEKDPEEKQDILASDPAAKQLQQQLASWEQSLLSAGGSK